ncbi:MAG: hypothetical protein WEC59_05495 [Salibacteraceae bacterium]
MSDKKLKKQINFAEHRLSKKLLECDISSLPLSDYTQKYLSNKLVNLNNELQLYGRLLYMSIINQNLPIKGIILVD